MKDLPRFRSRDPQAAQAFIAHILTNKADARSALVRLSERQDHSFRAIFAARFFVLNPGETEPSKSQWNNLKKKIKRAAPDVFVFKEHGTTDCAPGQPGCYYIDFAYFLQRTTQATPPAYRQSDGDAARKRGDER
jgi:hypothetical protein